jgi:hypothetical protein
MYPEGASQTRRLEPGEALRDSGEAALFRLAGRIFLRMAPMAPSLLKLPA